MPVDHVLQVVREQALKQGGLDQLPAAGLIPDDQRRQDALHREVRGTVARLPEVRELRPVTLLGVVIVAALILTAWNVIEDTPIHLRVYTAVVFLIAFGSSVTYLCSKPRFLLPAFLLTLPLARQFGRQPTPLLVGLAGILAAASTWFGVYLTVVARLPP